MANQGVLRRTESTGKTEALLMKTALRATGKIEEADDFAGQTQRSHCILARHFG